MSIEQSQSVMPTPLSTVNRRQWTRFPPDPQIAELVASGRQWEVRVTDESFGGIGLVVADEIPLEVGEDVQVIHHEILLSGTVRSVIRNNSPETQVGIEWLAYRTDRGGQQGQLNGTCHFFSLGTVQVACRPLKVHGDKVDVGLPDGSRMMVPDFELDIFTRTERRRELERLESELMLLCGLYRLGVFHSEKEAMRAVLDIEFAKSWE